MSYVEVQGQYSPNRTVAGVTSSTVYYRIVKHFSDETLIRTVNRRFTTAVSTITDLNQIQSVTKNAIVTNFKIRFILTAFTAKRNFEFSVFATVTSI